MKGVLRMADSRAIGVFDSGLGGLTVAREIIKLLPQENIVYFGDTGRVPYGTRSHDTIKKYALQDENLAAYRQDLKKRALSTEFTSSCYNGIYFSIFLRYFQVVLNICA